MAESDPSDFPEAMDVPPENAFDINTFVAGSLEAIKAKWPILLGPAGIAVDIWQSKGKGDAAFFSSLGLLIKKCLEEAPEALTPILQIVVQIAVQLLKPGTQILGQLTNSYILALRGEGDAKSPAGLPVPGGPGHDPSAAVFDQIMAPLLGMLTPSNPEASGAGENNSQHILGTLIHIHLMTWMVNVISNLTGVGVFKWINSFDEAITSGISARGFSRLATKPYLMKYVVDPLTGDLNRKWPTESGTPSTLLKTYMRGGITREELLGKLRGKGFKEEVVEQLLLDTVRLYTFDELAHLYRYDKLTVDDVVKYAAQIGYPDRLVPPLLGLYELDLIESQHKTIASDLVQAMGDHRIDNETARHIFASLDFSDAEVNAYILRGAMLAELPKRLSLSQVRELYNESLVDAEYVLDFLKAEQYADSDADLLFLLLFTKKDQREHQRGILSARRRVQAEVADEAAAKAEGERRAALAELEAALTAK